MHVSNRHLELASVVAGIAAANGLVTRVNDVDDLDETVNPVQIFRHGRGGRRAATRISGRSRESEDWELKEPDPSQWVWTDDYSNIVGSMLRKLKE